MATPTSATFATEAEGRTFASVFLDAVQGAAGQPALRTLGPDARVLTYGDYADQVARVAAGLQAMGVRKGDRVVLMLRNIPEFHVLDTAITFCGATPISIYNSSAPEQIAYLAGHSEARFAIVEDDLLLERFATARPNLPLLRAVAAVRGTTEITYAGLVGHDPIDLEAAAHGVQPSDLATVIYTSGTTGPPKGVMLTQRNLVYTLLMTEHSALAAAPDLFGFRTISYLPMAHIAERMSTHYTAVAARYDVACLPDMAQLGGALREVRPQILVGVPRVWEKLHAGLVAALSADTEKLTKFEAGIAAAVPIVHAKLAGDATDEQLATLAFLDEVAFAPVRALLGLDALRIAITSAAPIAPELVDWFRALGVPLTELYGMSESSGPMTWEAVHPRAGSVGRAIPGCEVVLAPDGELLCRGGNVFAGYLKDPARTAEMFDADGWLHSGDIATIADDGLIHIVDRKKELVITAGGKNISPANLEAKLKLVPLVGQACAIGDAKPFMSALLVLDPDQARAFAAREGLGELALDELAVHPRVAAVVEAGVHEAMAEFNNAEQVKRWTILGLEWLADSDELTPTMKLKRRNVATKYAAEIAAMYA
jgi:long-chain acyl-CoA synthetase